MSSLPDAQRWTIRVCSCMLLFGLRVGRTIRQVVPGRTAEQPTTRLLRPVPEGPPESACAPRWRPFVFPEAGRMNAAVTCAHCGYVNTVFRIACAKCGGLFR